MITRLLLRAFSVAFALGFIGSGASAVTITLQPIDGKDTWIYEAEDFDHGSDRELRTNESRLFDQRILIEFSDLSAIPGSAVVTSATLELYRYEALNDFQIALSAYQVTSAWAESVTWSTRPTIAATAEDTVLATVNGWYGWDLTALVQAWHSGAEANFGVSIFDSGFGRFQRFASSDVGGGGFGGPHPGEDFRPRLIISYVPEPSTALLVGAGFLGLAIRRRLRL